jgi:hypothetical protein
MRGFFYALHQYFCIMYAALQQALMGETLRRPIVPTHRLPRPTSRVMLIHGAPVKRCGLVTTPLKLLLACLLCLAVAIPVIGLLQWLFG